MFRKSLFWLPLAAIIAYAGICAVIYISDQIYYTSALIATSPNGAYKVFEVISSNDGGDHAPYGSHIVLSTKKKVATPADGYVVFAGYCASDVGAEWKDDSNLVVYCQRTDPARTEAVRAYALSIEHINSVAPSNNSLQARRP